VMGHLSLLVACGLWLAAWVVAATFVQLRLRLGVAPQPTLRARIAAQPRHWWGMTVAHLGVAIFIVGVTLVKGYETERDLRMTPGEKVAIGGYEFTFKGTRDAQGPNYVAAIGDFEVRRAGSPDLVRMMNPEKRLYHATGQTMTEAAIDTGLVRDLYVSLGEQVGDGNAWGVRVYHKPFVDWIWGGCFTMALGGILALSDRRYRTRKAATAPEGAAAARA